MSAIHNLLTHRADLTSRPLERVEKDFKRDFYLTAAESVDYGICDAVMFPKEMPKRKVNREEDNAKVTFGHFCESNPVYHPYGRRYC
jgi:hypothetical protein